MYLPGAFVKNSPAVLEIFLIFVSFVKVDISNPLIQFSAVSTLSEDEKISQPEYLNGVSLQFFVFSV